MMHQETNKTLVFSIALNGYQWLYKDFIGSHKRFAKRYGYDYEVINKPYFTRMGVECCWLKLTLLLKAFEAGYDNVVYFDADAFVADDAPSLNKIIRQPSLLFMAKGYSGRFNSGVIVAKQHAALKTWISNVIDSRHQTVSSKHSVGWGENGHIILHAETANIIGELDRRWNNTFDPALDDYVRHFSFGPLRKSLLLNLVHKALNRTTRLISYLADDNTDSLERLTQQVINHHRVFVQL